MKSSYPSNLKFNLKGKEFVKITFPIVKGNSEVIHNKKSGMNQPRSL